MLVGRPSDEKSGGALLHADNIDTAAASGNSTRKRDALTLEIFIRNPFLMLFLLIPRVCHAELSACLPGRADRALSGYLRAYSRATFEAPRCRCRSFPSGHRFLLLHRRVPGCRNARQ